MKKTDWFPADVKPVHVGVYRVVKSFGECWAYWNGKRWSHGFLETTLYASDVQTMKTSYRWAYPVKQWRGLAEKPE